MTTGWARAEVACTIKMNMAIAIIVTTALLPIGQGWSSISPLKNQSQKMDLAGAGRDLLQRFAVVPKEKKDLLYLKAQSLKLAGKAVPVLIRVMKESQYPDKNRWLATMLLGKIMGQKASPYLIKYTDHSHWVLRMAALKTLLYLGEKRFGDQYAKMLKDPSLLVRMQALKNIRVLKMTTLSPQVWKMLFDRKNYKKKQGKLLVTSLIGEVIATVGQLKYQRATQTLAAMLQRPSFEGLFFEIDQTLGHLTGQPSPTGDKQQKRSYWAARIKK